MKVEEENESKRMLSDLSKRVDDLQDSVSKIAEALSYLMASSSDKEEKEELAEKVDLLSSYANECIEHNDAVCVVWVDWLNSLRKRTRNWRRRMLNWRARWRNMYGLCDALSVGFIVPSVQRPLVVWCKQKNRIHVYCTTLLLGFLASSYALISFSISSYHALRASMIC